MSWVKLIALALALAIVMLVVVVVVLSQSQSQSPDQQHNPSPRHETRLSAADKDTHRVCVCLPSNCACLFNHRRVISSN